MWILHLFLNISLFNFINLSDSKSRGHLLLPRYSISLCVSSGMQYLIGAEIDDVGLIVRGNSYCCYPGIDTVIDHGRNPGAAFIG